MKTITAQEFIDWISLYTNYRYLTRDKDGTVTLFDDEPIIANEPNSDEDCYEWYCDDDTHYVILDERYDLFNMLNCKIMFVNTGGDWTQDIVKCSHEK